MARARLLVVLLALAGCGGGDRDAADREAITEKLEQLRMAQERKDARLACSDVYLVQERGRKPEAEGREECIEAFTLAVVDRPDVPTDIRTQVTRIDLEGDAAVALVRFRARRADGSAIDREDRYELVRTARGWRIRIAGEG